ncbi:MAG: N-acetyl-alpha-D-glucosaminyl L-malate synthase BshA [Planctomycetota bacterium]
MIDRSLRIAIACYPSYGGSGIVATELGIALAERGHDVHFLAYADLPRLSGSSRVQVHKVEVSAYPLFKFPPYDLALTSKILELLGRESLDILHVHYAIPHSICAYLARQIHPDPTVRVVTTLHGTDITVVGADEAYREVTCFGIRHSDRIIAVSEHLALETRQLFGVDCPIHVIPNFVDTERFCPGEKSVAPPFTLVHLSNFRDVKRPLDVIQAFAILRRHVDARLTLIGDGPLLQDCLDLAERLLVRDLVDSLGAVQDVASVLACCDLLLQPSGSEAFGLAALEAMACGTPVVGYKIGGLPEVIIDGETGFLVPFRDVRALAARATQVLTDEKLRRRMAREGRRRAVEVFNVSHCVDLHEALYLSALADPPSP